jgi:hypothetical protein
MAAVRRSWSLPSASASWPAIEVAPGGRGLARKLDIFARDVYAVRTSAGTGLVWFIGNCDNSATPTQWWSLKKKISGGPG